MKIIDISVSVDNILPIWPQVSKPRFNKISSIKKGDLANDTKIEMSAHTGTHIDAQLHFIEKGKSINEETLETFIGPAFVAYLSKVEDITSEDLKKLKLPKGTKRLLLRTSNSDFWKKGISKFQKDYVGITTDAASWLVRQGIELVGVDYLSVAKYNEVAEVHRILLSKNVVLLEGINLTGVKSGMYQLMCLPLKISDIEASPVRAVLIKK